MSLEATELARETEIVALRDVGLLESPKNSNRHPRIDYALKRLAVAIGNPYCAALASLWVQEAAQRFDRQFKGSARALGIWERNTDLQVPAVVLRSDPQLVASILPALFILDHGGGKGHVYLGIGYDAATATLTAIDPNTSPKGDTREGGGVYVTQRPLHDARMVGAVRIA
jgi:hypothetical protein